MPSFTAITVVVACYNIRFFRSPLLDRTGSTVVRSRARHRPPPPVLRTVFYTELSEARASKYR